MSGTIATEAAPGVEPGDLILDRIPDDVNPRKAPGLAVKVAVLLRMLGLVGPVQWDHRPPLWTRKWNATKGDTVPPANDPDHLVALSEKAHDTVTNGPGGERRITSAGGDTHARAKEKRLRDEQAAFRDRLLSKGTAEPRPAAETPRSRLGGRGLGQHPTKKRGFDGKVVDRVKPGRRNASSLPRR